MESFRLLDETQQFFAALEIRKGQASRKMIQLAQRQTRQADCSEERGEHCGTLLPVLRGPVHDCGATGKFEVAFAVQAPIPHEAFDHMRVISITTIECHIFRVLSVRQ